MEDTVAAATDPIDDTRPAPGADRTDNTDRTDTEALGGQLPAGAAPPARSRYVLGDVLGRGGMGVVVAARDRHLDREIAIKRLHRGRDSDAMLSRFIREARVQACLQHPAIAPIHELDRDEQGRPFLVMKRINGVTLADTIARVDRSDPGAMHRLLTAFAQVCLAIDYAHEKGIVHRDIKPANVILGDYGDVYVLDWGVAKVMDESEAARHAIDGDVSVERSPVFTQAGSIIGTPGYMAPEQAAGAAVDRRVDVYALGCVLFEILVGAPMHPREQLLQPLSEERRRPSGRGADVAPELDDLCGRATATEVDERVASARAFHLALDRYLSGDRDLARRRELATTCIDSAEAALSDGDSALARTTAMREASQALALQPDNMRARALVARLVLEPPSEVPAEVTASLEAVRALRSQQFGRLGIAKFLSLVMFFPFIWWMGIREPWLIVAVGVVAAAGIGVAIQCARGRGGRWAHYGVLIASAVIVALSSRVFSSFTVVPLFALGWASVAFAHPARLSATAIVAAFSTATLTPSILEAVGVIEATTRFEDGVATLDNAGLWFPAAPTLVAFSLLIVGALLMVGTILVKMRRKLEDEEAALALQAWQLERGLPSGTLAESRIDGTA